MINIAVCIKQVPTFSNNAVDLETGLLKRELLSSSINLNDLSALEAALQLKASYVNKGFEAEVHAFSMGPKSAEKMLHDSFALGVDRAYLLNNKAFAGADVISTSYALSQGIQAVEKRLATKFSVILCGNQTSDGGTAFVHTALATHLNYPVIAYTSSIDFENSNNSNITACQHLESNVVKVKANTPLVLSILPDNFTPRVPSLKLKMQAKKKEVEILSLEDFENADINHYGLKGARTKVVKSYTPQVVAKNDILNAFELGNNKIAEKILKIISE